MSEHPVVGIVGHNLTKLGGRSSAYAAHATAELERVIRQLAPTSVVTDLNRGPGMWAAGHALSVNAEVEAVIPYAGFDGSWPAVESRALTAIMARSHITVASQLPTLEAWQHAHDLIVERSELVVAVWNGQRSGGTFRFLHTALLAGLPAIVIGRPGLRTMRYSTAVALARRLNVTLVPVSVTLDDDDDPDPTPGGYVVPFTDVFTPDDIPEEVAS